MDIVDEQLDTTARTFMGLTVACARCHDHKFDPIPQADYYSLAGIFKSSKTMENFNVVAQWHEYVLAPEAEREKLKAHKARIEAKNKEIGRISTEEDNKLIREARDHVGSYLLAADDVLRYERAPCAPRPPAATFPRTPSGVRPRVSIAATRPASSKRKSRTRPRGSRAPTSPSMISPSPLPATTSWISSKKRSAPAPWM